MKFRACSTFSDRHSTLLECQNHFELVQDPVYGNFSLGVAHLIAENYQQAEKFLSLSKNSIPELVLYKIHAITSLNSSLNSRKFQNFHFNAQIVIFVGNSQQ